MFTVKQEEHISQMATKNKLLKCVRQTQKSLAYCNLNSINILDYPEDMNMNQKMVDSLVAVIVEAQIFLIKIGQSGQIADAINKQMKYYPAMEEKHD